MGMRAVKRVSNMIHASKDVGFQYTTSRADYFVLLDVTSHCSTRLYVTKRSTV